VPSSSARSTWANAVVPKIRARIAAAAHFEKKGRIEGECSGFINFSSSITKHIETEKGLNMAPGGMQLTQELQGLPETAMSPGRSDNDFTKTL
jgi:hypothetical protein